jgi:hypothetical protein
MNIGSRQGGNREPTGRVALRADEGGVTTVRGVMRRVGMARVWVPLRREGGRGRDRGIPEGEIPPTDFFGRGLPVQPVDARLCFVQAHLIVVVQV